MARAAVEVGRVPTFPKVLPGEVRAKARAGLLEDLDTLQGVIDSELTSATVKVQAVKLKATIGGVLSSQSLPRDVVEEKIGETAQYLRQRFGDEVFATMADDLSNIWNL